MVNTRTIDARIRRIAASVALVAFGLVVLPRPAVAPSTHRCPPAPAGIAAVVPAPEHCDHAQTGPCADMLGCFAVPAALVTAPPALHPVATLTAPPAGSPAAPPGQLALGPPTPPPDS
jgi:hypothetical protein